MGNGVGKLTVCFTGDPFHHLHRQRNHDNYLYQPDPIDDTVGHSFYYLRPDPHLTSISSDTLFRSISGASLSANTSTTPLSTSYVDPTTAAAAAANTLSGPLLETSTSFASAPLLPVPRSDPLSGPLDRAGPGYSGPASGFLSGPLDRAVAGFLSGPLDRTGPKFSGQLGRSVSHGPGKWRPRFGGGSVVRGIRRVISRTFGHNSVVAPIIGNGSDRSNTSSERKRVEKMDSMEIENNAIEWAQGRAGEDRVHVAVSEEHGWVFVGIYDGFSGPDATDFLLSKLYAFVEDELGSLWEDEGDDDSKSKFDSLERLDLDNQRLIVDHSEVLRALSRALSKAEEAYFEISDKLIDENAELAMMGSCVLAMLMKGEDVYVMNVGDSRALLAKTKDVSIDHELLECINEECLDDFKVFDGVKPSLLTFQLTMDHSTCVEEEVKRIKDEHKDDPLAIVNDRVKGTLKVTRAFGAGFLKQPKWNNALLEMFRIDYVGTSPYLNCLPSLCHHRLGPRDQFLILSSDGLYQYFTNEEAVAEVELFMSMSPEGDPAQHLVEEVLLRAAKKAGMDFYELLEIPQGDRRKYHDDVSIIIISFEGRIWRSCV